MKLTMRLGAAIAIAALGACSQAAEDNYADNTDANATYTTNETVLPPDENAAGSDTLGNQMNQLNESDTMNTDSADTTQNTTTNGY